MVNGDRLDVRDVAAERLRLELLAEQHEFEDLVIYGWSPLSRPAGYRRDEVPAPAPEDRPAEAGDEFEVCDDGTVTGIGRW